LTPRAVCSKSRANCGIFVLASISTLEGLSMPSRPARLLCVGKELDSLQTRCAVLSHSGYDAKSATVAEAEILLRTEEFDLVIISAFLSQEEQDNVISAAPATPTLVLDGVTFPSELLAQVERRLSPVA
jgi:hypothetical protein